jgi:hypothetical protein
MSLIIVEVSKIMETNPHIRQLKIVALLVTPVLVLYFDKKEKSNPSLERQNNKRDNDNKEAIADDINPHVAPVITKYCIPSKCLVTKA